MTKTATRFAAATAFLAIAAIASSSLSAQDISHRKADLTVQVQTGSGTPLEGATVEIEMLNHAFRFGCAVEYDDINPSSNDYDEFTVTQLQKYFNSTTYGNIMKWTYYEARTDEVNQALAALPQTFNAFDGPDNLRLRGHVTVWGAEYQVPDRVRSSDDGAYISEQILNHVFDYHTTFKDSGIDNYDLYNEHFNVPELLIDKIASPDDMAAQAAEVARWFNKAKEADPNAILFINDFNILNDWSNTDNQVKAYKAFIDAVRDAGGQMDGIGLQAHIDHPNISREVITRRLDLLAADMAPTENHPNGLPGLRIEITELDMAVKNEIHNASWVPWTNATMEEQVAQTDAVMSAAFEHPSVDGITIWGLDDFRHWRGNAIMYDNLAEGSTDRNRIHQEPVLKETGQLYIDRVLGDWWEDHSGSSSANGDYTANTFKGTHRITVTFDGETKEQIVSLDDAQTLTVTFAAEAADATTYDAWVDFIEWDFADTARTADPDQDGRNNLQEYLTGTDPLAIDSTARYPIIRQSDGSPLTLTFPSRAQGVEVLIEYSPDMQTWTDINELAWPDVVPTPQLDLNSSTQSNGQAMHTLTFSNITGFFRVTLSEPSAS
ncbi:endo-1,4-beta-xylanase [Pelagicoccus sp. SDUM812003]|uniref:endo-1,4-beta-xylanase n=1 Tax=Pelagicoccus sp. SDUM812003 TaxID=3041267 RepID=UPI00280FF5CA|nr:endo-1,4-beta-xylanase [Pelagicoccus sp. SDUM812003]MDQ8202953.1 endo-1,4-beta-xylanase [Pelagicoccus sp. SDUM812003]